MNSDPVSKSSTLRGPKFDEEIDVKRVSTATPVNTWKVVQSNTVKKLSFQDENLISMKSFTIKTTNRFEKIKEESCHPFHIEDTEPDADFIYKTIQNKLEKEKITNKKVKKIKNKKIKTIQKCYITNSKMGTPSLIETHRKEVKRCNKCFVNHYPSLQKFCRWAEEHADRNKRKVLFKPENNKRDSSGSAENDRRSTA